MQLSLPSYPPLTPRSKTTQTGTSGYSVNPSPRSGVNAYGMVPGSTSLPNPFNDLASIYPNLSGANSQISQNIMSELRGELSPEVVNNVRDNAAVFGVTSGMPGSQFANFRGLKNIGLETANLQGKGLQDYLAAITGIKGTQTVSPDSQIALSQSNAQLAAAPDPEMAALEQRRLFDEYMERVNAELKASSAPATRKPKDYIEHSYGMGLGGATPWMTNRTYY